MFVEELYHGSSLLSVDNLRALYIFDPPDPYIVVNHSRMNWPVQYSVAKFTTLLFKYSSPPVNFISARHANQIMSNVSVLGFHYSFWASPKRLLIKQWAGKRVAKLPSQIKYSSIQPTQPLLNPMEFDTPTNFGIPISATAPN